MHNIKATCLFCNKELNGRMDKKFCDVHCRSAYHNSVANKDEDQIKKVNKILRKNRSILKFASPQGKTTINKSFLVDREFNFNYLTSTYESKAGNTYKFCYDYGYMLLDAGKVLIVNWQPYMDK